MADHRVEPEVLCNLLLHASELVGLLPSHENAVCCAAIPAGADEVVRLLERPLQAIQRVHNLGSLHHLWVLQHPQKVIIYQLHVLHELLAGLLVTANRLCCLYDHRDEPQRVHSHQLCNSGCPL